MVTYFLDSYAIMEMIKGNKAYEPYIHAEFITTIMNLYEIYYNLLKVSGEEEAHQRFMDFRELAVEVCDEHIFLASKFRMKHTTKDVSYIDSLGYAIAMLNHIQFLTGDKAFEHMENVAFVK